jgi:hypothetical protein
MAGFVRCRQEHSGEPHLRTVAGGGGRRLGHGLREGARRRGAAMAAGEPRPENRAAAQIQVQKPRRHR